jgi:phosphatidate cytidylyltransferase
MNKIIMGLILSIITCFAIIFDLVDMFTLLAIIVGMYELIDNYMKIKKETLLIGFGLLVLIITGQIISSKVLNLKELIFILGIIIVSDVFQEFAGRQFGKNKIGWISPNKTYEGYIGGYIGILIIYFTKLNFKHNFLDLNLIYFFGIFGDLFFSYIKRKIEVKDYSNILLSHGGMLDRADAYLISLLGYGLYKKLIK